jgi:hypothetical protein
VIKRYSSRKTNLGGEMLVANLKGSTSYDRIAGYFRTSLFEVAGEALLEVKGDVRIVCNSDLRPDDVITVANAFSVLRTDWCSGHPENTPPAKLQRYQALLEALNAGRIRIKVLPDEVFGLIHGKAGVIRYGGTRSDIAFMGSVNESYAAWMKNYELLWEDDNPEAVSWVQEEFNALWTHTKAVDITDWQFLRADLERIIKRHEIALETWKREQNLDIQIGAATVESPLYRKEQGLWPHQKYFCRLALERHRQGGARLVLADQVGLGKTVQLALSALLIALDSAEDLPILVLAPTPLLKQWQEELVTLLGIPSARWNGRAWIDESDPDEDRPHREFSKCPRKLALVSHGIIVNGAQSYRDQLLSRRYACVIVDESHRARRKNIPKSDAEDSEVDETPQPNNLLKFLNMLSPRTSSMLLATATPVQLHPVEAWDLLNILSRGGKSVLGDEFSRWRTPSVAIRAATGKLELNPDDADLSWEYVRNPLPAASEGDTFRVVRSVLNIDETEWVVRRESRGELGARFDARVRPMLPAYCAEHNPLIRCIVRRTREHLESTVNPQTGEYYLPKVEVRLFGEDSKESVIMTPYLQDAYVEAERFCQLLQKRVKGAGFFKTLLLRRLGSSAEAGRHTVAKLLASANQTNVQIQADIDDDADTDDAEEVPQGGGGTGFSDHSPAEIQCLVRVQRLLETVGDDDPKLNEVLAYLNGTKPGLSAAWRERGCILFSQYYSTAYWLGSKLAEHPEFQGMCIGLYAGGSKSGIWEGGKFRRLEREKLKQMVRTGELKLLLGTDAASEGLNLQRLGTLINVDLPWNPTRLEQRKGRIQRIGQINPDIWIANLRYRDSVEDKVHEVLATRLAHIHNLFGQIPDTLEDVWVKIALNDEEDAKRLIDRTEAAPRNPFDEKYSKVEDYDWETCSAVLDKAEIQQLFKRGW